MAVPSLVVPGIGAHSSHPPTPQRFDASTVLGSVRPSTGTVQELRALLTPSPRTHGAASNRRRAGRCSKTQDQLGSWMMWMSPSQKVPVEGWNAELKVLLIWKWWMPVDGELHTSKFGQICGQSVQIWEILSYGATGRLKHSKATRAVRTLGSIPGPNTVLEI